MNAPKIKKFRFELHKPSFEFLGHIISVKGIAMDPNKLVTTQDWPLPTLIKEM